MAIDASRAEAAARDLARALKLTVGELAEGVVRVANANMERALRVVSVERGHDPRQFALVAFGGAGGMHACEIADPLEINTVVVPRHAGVLSALGMLLADVARDYSASVLRPASALTSAALGRRTRPLVSRAHADLAREGFVRGDRVVVRQLDVRYLGQSFEIAVPFTPGYVSDFHRRHARLYGYSNPDRAVEVVTARVRATGVTSKPVLPRVRRVRPFRPQPADVRPARFSGRSRSTAFHRWSELEPGAAAHGPAVITGGEATTVVPPGWRFVIDAFGNIVARRR
jgi:N-methylhydantoinase A/oxoprolinase/acetone carboxylase beta subunit